MCGWLARSVLLVVAVGISNALSFDVATIKESTSLEQDGVFRQQPGRFTVTNLSLRSIIRYAFRLREYQVVQVPSWADTRYSINATFANAAADNEQVRTMMQSLLADRFALRSHRESRTLRKYALTKARADGAFGPKLARSDVDCGKRPVAPQTCAMFETAWSIRGFTRTIPQLVQLLDEIVGSPVQDRTGLTGTFNFDLQWGKPGDVPIDPSQQTVESLASLFTALQEQLGLKLESERGPVDVLVVDHVEKPTPD